MNKTKKPREFCEVTGGKYDKYGFYYTPNGSFWDCDGIYFDRTGKDVHNGYYDEEMNYHPGEGWIESLMCYEDEMDTKNIIGGLDDDKDNNDFEEGDYDMYEDINEDMNRGNFKGKEVSYYDAVNDKSKSQNYKKIDLKEDKNNYKQVQVTTQNIKPTQTVQVQDKSNITNKKKEVVEAPSITSNTVKEVLSNKKDSKVIKVEGYQISTDLDFDD